MTKNLGKALVKSPLNVTRNFRICIVCVLLCEPTTVQHSPKFSQVMPKLPKSYQFDMQ